jgi:hypothetical protein
MLSPSRHLLYRLDSSAIRSSPTPNRKHERASAKHRPDDADDYDLQRLESSIEWLKRESMIARAETEGPGQKNNLRLPRASQLMPLSGIRPFDIESSSHLRKALPLRLTAPLPHELCSSHLRGGSTVMVCGQGWTSRSQPPSWD